MIERIPPYCVRNSFKQKKMKIITKNTLRRLRRTKLQTTLAETFAEISPYKLAMTSAFSMYKSFRVASVGRLMDRVRIKRKILIFSYLLYFSINFTYFFGVRPALFSGGKLPVQGVLVSCGGL